MRLRARTPAPPNSGLWRCGRLARACVNARNYCIGEGAFAQPGTEVVGGEASIPGEAENFEPEPGSNGDVDCERFSLELSGPEQCCSEAIGGLRSGGGCRLRRR